MGVPPLSDDEWSRTKEALDKHNWDQAAAGRELGKARTTIQSRIIAARAKKLIPDGSPLEGFRVKGTSTLYDAEGEVKATWVKTAEDSPDPVLTAEKIKEVFNDLVFEVPPVPAPAETNPDCLSLFNVPDLHMGLYVYGKEAAENWDLKKSDRVYRQAFGDLVGMSPKNSTAILLGGGDQMHSDNSSNVTFASGHSLDVDGRYERVLLVTCELFLHFATLLLQTHDSLIIRILKGNHDPHAYAAIAYFLLASFRNEPRVTVDVSPSLFWVHHFGKVMLAATHGHTAKPQNMPGIMAARWPEIWGKTQFRYAHTFHVHHRAKYVHEDGGAIVETHHSPAPQDSYNYGHGYLSGRSLKSIVYHKKFGEFGGAVRPIMPE